MATQGQILTDLRDRLDETTAHVWQDRELRSAVNEVARDIARRTMSIRDETIITSTADLGKYALPQDCVQIHLVEYTENQHTQYPEYRDRHSMQNAWGSFQNQSGWPAVYTMWGAPPNMQLHLYPVPSVDGAQIKVLYYRFPRALSVTDDSDQHRHVEIPAGWEDVLIDGAEAKALRKGRDPRWQEAQALYEANLAEMAEVTMRFTDQAGQIDWNGTPSWLTDFDAW